MTNLEKQTENLNKKEKMYLIYGEERTERYVSGNMAADKLADEAMKLLEGM